MKTLLRLYKLYADEGISGKQIKHRKQFQAMMQDAKAHKFQRVVVKDVSRFARNTVDLLQSIRELKSYGIQVDFLNNGEVMEGGSEFILTILGAMAQQESLSLDFIICCACRFFREKATVTVFR